MNAPQNPTAPGSTAGDPQPARKSNPKRRTGLLLLAGVVLVGAIGFGAYDFFVASHYEGTDNAYVQGNVVQLTPQVGGTVIAIHAEDTDFVKAGQPLVQLDPADAKVALAQFEAALAQAVRQVRTLYANNGALSAQVTLRQADVARAQSELGRANDDLKRRQSLAKSGAVSGEELQHSRAQVQSAASAVAAAQAGVAAAREQLLSNRAMTEGTSVERHPLVQAAAAKVREAWLALKRVTLPAPVDGYVARRTVQLGQRVAPGAPLMALIPLGQVWVEANLKEGQLRNVRIGQPAKVTADVYGGKVEYRGTVAGLGAGTGSAFALLPAQNATGNWIKVVQRVPVRIELDQKQLDEHPLRIGLSMNATIDVHDQSGNMLAAGSAGPASQTQVYNEQDDGAERAIQRVIAANGGASPASASLPAPAAIGTHPLARDQKAH
ncbi:MAG: efflux RND transporter periplasmic adaptor subunit [Burkholderiales bacterium]